MSGKITKKTKTQEETQAETHLNKKTILFPEI